MSAKNQFVDIHPFLDGNGRSARVLCTLVLYQNGYDFKRLFSLSEYYDKARNKYYDAIQSVREENDDLTGWLAQKRNPDLCFAFWMLGFVCGMDIGIWVLT